MSHRRFFLQKLALAGISLPWMHKLRITRTSFSTANLPVILCSRGKDWGQKVLDPAWEKFKESGSILDSVEAGANVTELDPDDMSVGYGGLPNEDGVVTLDASVMYGPTHKCGSVASLENIKRACSVARLVMERTDHIMLVGPGALRFAKAHGFPEENLLTDEARRVWLRWKENMSTQDDWLPEPNNDYGLKDRPKGTINVLGIDGNGNVAGITTTSGLFGKLAGRVGDSPIIGAGLYVDNAVGAAGATGRGEEVIRTCGSFLTVEYMRHGMSPQEACEAVCHRIVEVNGGLDKVDFDDKIVAVNTRGEAGCASIMGSETELPEAAIMTKEGFQLVKGTYLKQWKDKD
ncbi:MAG TPA: N(4)-(beta-N-acetylglucosaminyl)-L-asparaginase [Saprospiraceae bacterium]|nr:N(4)-(beta-N-acetylglucosaminyl)-L-asparaginase [Saprospiraceae bacterium]